LVAFEPLAQRFDHPHPRPDLDVPDLDSSMALRADYPIAIYPPQ
jgi:hypothetical protein